MYGLQPEGYNGGVSGVRRTYRSVLMILQLRKRWSVTSVVMKVALDSAA